jgi:hypothetical protein
LAQGIVLVKLPNYEWRHSDVSPFLFLGLAKRAKQIRKHPRDLGRQILAIVASPRLHTRAIPSARRIIGNWRTIQRRCLKCHVPHGS